MMVNVIRGSSNKEYDFFYSTVNFHARLMKSRPKLACLFWLSTCTIFDALHSSNFCSLTILEDWDSDVSYLNVLML